MNKFSWRLLAVLIVTAITLAACGGIDPSLVICPKNPAALPADQQVCRANTDQNLDPNKEMRVAALQVGTQQRAIYYGYAEDSQPILIDQVGQHPYPASQSIVLPLQVQDFRTDSNPDGDFCASQRPRCIAPIGNMTLEYLGGDGQVRTMANVTINIVGSLRFLVDEKTDNAWLSLDRSRTVEDFWYKFWDRVRTPKILSIVESDVDPVSDQWGEATNQALAAALTARLTSWDLANLVEITNGALTVKSVDIPASQEAETNIDVQATQAAADLARAEAFATQVATICQDLDDLACALVIQSYTGQGQTGVVVQPPTAATPAP